MYQRNKFAKRDCRTCNFFYNEGIFLGKDSNTLVATEVQCLKGVHPKMSEIVTIDADAVEDIHTMDDLCSFGTSCSHREEMLPHDFSQCVIHPKCCTLDDLFSDK